MRFRQEKSCLSAFPLLVCKAHFEEVQSKHLHEKEQCIEGGKNSPHVGEDVQKFKVPAVGHLSDRGPFDPEVGGGGSGVEDGLPLLAPLACEAGLGGKVGERQQAGVGSYFVFVEFVDVLVPDSVAKFQDISVEVVEEGVLAVGVGYSIQFVYVNAATVVDSAGLGAVKAEENALPGVAEFEGSPDLIVLIEGKAQCVCLNSQG